MGANKLKAVIRCPESIPCNPCESACPTGAIRVGDPVSNLPELDTGLCTGCGICVAVCPGMAIRLMGQDPDQAVGLAGIPCEYRDETVPGENVTVLDRNGQVLGPGRIRRVFSPVRRDPTRVVILEVPLEYVEEVEGYRKESRDE